jgi:hypothetical protein
MHRRITEVRNLAPGVGDSIIPDSEIWSIKGLDQEEIMIKTMQWKLLLKKEAKLPKHRITQKFHLNKLRVA